MKQKTPDEDEQLVSLYRGGNVSAFNTLLIRYIPKIRQAVRRFLSNPEDINDVLQDICIHVGTKLKNTYNEKRKILGVAYLRSGKLHVQLLPEKRKSLFLL